MVKRWMPIRAHFDGKVIVPDEPINLPPGTPITVAVRTIEHDPIDADRAAPRGSPVSKTPFPSHPSQREIRVECGGECFVLALPSGREHYTIREMIEMGWLVPLDRAATLLNGSSVDLTDRVQSGQTVVQLPIGRNLRADAPGDASTPLERRRRLEGAIGLFQAPSLPPEALSRDALYDEDP